MFLQAITAWGNSKKLSMFWYIIILLYPVVSLPFQDDVSGNVYFDIYLNESYLKDGKLLLNISHDYIISNCESYVLSAPFWVSQMHHNISALSSCKQKLATYCKHWNKSHPLPWEVSLWKTDRDKTEAETMSWVPSAFSLSVARKPLFGLFWQVSFSLHSLSPQASAFSPEVSLARCGDPGFFAAACVAGH